MLYKLRIIIIVTIYLFLSIQVYAFNQSSSGTQFLGISINENNEFIINNKIDLEGSIVHLPASTSIVFKGGGSIKNGTVILHDNCGVYGNNTILYAYYKIRGTIVSHQSLFVAESCSNIILKDITIRGGYKEAYGNLNPWGDNSPDSQSLVFIKDCKNVKLDNVTVTKFYNSRSNYYKTWDETYKSNHNMFPVLMYNCDNITLNKCKESSSCGEAWTIMNSRQITIDEFECRQKYGTSILSVIYCSDVQITDSHFEVKNSLGNIVNTVCQNFTISNCTFIGGDLDFGNEHANVDIDLDGNGLLGDNKTYVITNAHIINNLFRNASITNNTVKTVSIDYPISDVTIKNNIIEIDVSKRSSLRAINLGSYGSIKYCNISNNHVTFIGKYNRKYSSNSEYRYIPIVVYRPHYNVNELIITNNIILDKARWNRSKLKTLEMTKVLGSSILVNINKGNVILEDNNFQTLYDLNIKEGNGVTVISSNNGFIEKN